MAKICVICGLDVANLPRTKDAHGNYYCMTCAKSARAAKPAAASSDPALAALSAFAQPAADASEQSADNPLGALASISSARPSGPVEPPADPRDIAAARREIQMDSGPFYPIANGWSVLAHIYETQIFISPRALYLPKENSVGMRVTTIKQQAQRNAMAMSGGLLGVAAKVYLDGKRSPRHQGTHLHTCHVRDLPAVIQRSIDPKGKLAEGGIVVIPRATVSFIEDRHDGIAFRSGTRDFVALCPRDIRNVVATITAIGWEFRMQMTPRALPAFFIMQGESRPLESNAPLPAGPPPLP